MSCTSLISRAFAIALLLTVSYTNLANGQERYCSATAEVTQKVLDSRASKPVAYTENVTTGVAYLLAFECDSALSYFRISYSINPDPSLKEIISIMGGTVSEPAPASDNSQETPNVSPALEIEQAPPSEETTTSYSSSATKTFSAEELADFQAKGLQKVKRLTEYFNIIVQKSTSPNTAQTTIENAVLLFDREDNTVEVSSVNRPNTTRYPIRTYLNRLRMLNYQKVVIEGAAFTYVSSFRKGPDGNYYGVARFRQTFTGYRDNRPVYSDVTTKTVAVVLKPYQKAFEGESVENWDVFLGDISVKQTEK